MREAREGLPPEPLENENTLTVRIREWPKWKFSPEDFF